MRDNYLLTLNEVSNILLGYVISYKYQLNNPSLDVCILIE